MPIEFQINPVTGFDTVIEMMKQAIHAAISRRI
jgi:hypothetical protein